MTVQCAASLLHWLFVFQPQLLDPVTLVKLTIMLHVLHLDYLMYDIGTIPMLIWLWLSGIEYKSKIKRTESLNQGFMKISTEDSGFSPGSGDGGPALCEGAASWEQPFDLMAPRKNQCDYSGGFGVESPHHVHDCRLPLLSVQYGQATRDQLLESTGGDYKKQC